MAMQGSLKEMTVADIIQHTCQDRRVALLSVQESNGGLARVYFKDGAVIHATLGPLVGEEAVYRALSWTDGTFTLEVGVTSPEISIEKNWSSLIMEGVKRLDEYGQEGLLEKEEIDKIEDDRAKNVQETLQLLLSNSKEYVGAAIVGSDGYIKYNRLGESRDESVVSAVAASLHNLGNRASRLLTMGNLKSGVIQGEQGNVLISPINRTSLLVGELKEKSNIHTALIEANAVCQKLQKIL
jgi:predicted regulator of Ras-like GTPase activity (Roadblock/LC7/MglB family)